ncbi:MAG: DUF4747 family protein [Burkholderiaceae bacterium]
MATVSVAILNVAMPVPHSPKRYIELFATLNRLRIPAGLRSNHCGLVGVHKTEDPNNWVHGEFRKFFDIDVSDDWFNTLRQSVAKPEELKDVKIPPHLKPSYQYFPFVFMPARHRLVYISKYATQSLSPGQAKKLLDDLCESDAVLKKYGRIEVTVEPRKDALSEIWKIHQLRKLILEIVPPNPDDLQAEEKRILKRLQEENATAIRQEIRSREKAGLQPSKETKALARVAKSNGKVVGFGISANGKQVKRSTVNAPMIETVKYDPDMTTARYAMTETASRFVEKISD